MILLRSLQRRLRQCYLSGLAVLPDAGPPLAARGRPAAPRCWPVLCLLTLLCLLPCGAVASESSLRLVRGIYVELCIGSSIPLEWTAQVPEYSLAVPRDAPFVGLRVDVAHGETEEEQFSDEIFLRLPFRGLAIAMQPGRTSEWVEVYSNESAVLKLGVGPAEYTIYMIRSHIASNGLGEFPDPARRYPPPGTLSGLALWDSLGEAAHMSWFSPRTSMYYASISDGARDVRLVATANDPAAELEWRLNGGKWDFLVSGLTSAPARCSQGGWTLLEVRVRSTLALAIGQVSDYLIYQVAVTKELVCHPKCRTCRGPQSDQCTSCYAPLVHHVGKCLYTACKDVTTYFSFDVEECVSCHPSCHECQDGSAEGCIICPTGRFLLTSSVLDTSGECVVACPVGFFVQPLSQRCQRAPATDSLSELSFFIRLELRITVDELVQESDMLQRILRAAADLLQLSPLDVRYHRWDKASGGYGVDYYFEVENPFLSRHEVTERVTVDKWFAGLPVPVDRVIALSRGEMFPPPVGPKPPPLIPSWLIAAVLGALSGLLILCPMYHVYFIRNYWKKTPYRPETQTQIQFVGHVLEEAPDWVIHKVATKDRGVQ